MFAWVLFDFPKEMTSPLDGRSVMKLSNLNFSKVLTQLSPYVKNGEILITGL